MRYECTPDGKEGWGHSESQHTPPFDERETIMQNYTLWSSSRRYNFAAGRVYTPSLVFTSTTRTIPSSPGMTRCTRPRGHLPRLVESSETRTNSSTWRLGVFAAVLGRCVKVGRYSRTVYWVLVLVASVFCSLRLSHRCCQLRTPNVDVGRGGYGWASTLQNHLYRLMHA